MLLASLDQTIVSTALPTIVGELGGLNHLSSAVTAYLLATTVSGPLYGKLGDLYGRKIVLQSAVAIFLVGSALAASARICSSSSHTWARRFLPARCAASCFFTSLGGTTLAWRSLPIVALIMLSVVLTGAFAVVETRAAEPILPLALFRN